MKRIVRMAVVDINARKNPRFWSNALLYTHRYICWLII